MWMARNDILLEVPNPLECLAFLRALPLSLSVIQIKDLDNAFINNK